MPSLKCFAAALLFTCQSANAKMDWIYQELKREKPKDERVPEGNTDFTQVPQYYRFN